jgi:hypothetical protein
MTNIFEELTNAVRQQDNFKIEALLGVCRQAKIDSSQILFRFECAAREQFDSFDYDIKGDVIAKYEYDQRGEVSTVQLVNRTPEGSG